MDIERILKEMTLEDKIALCSAQASGKPSDLKRYGIPALFMCDGPPRSAKAGGCGGYAGRE